MKRLKRIQEKMMNIEDWGKTIPLKDNRISECEIETEAK